MIACEGSHFFCLLNYINYKKYTFAKFAYLTFFLYLCIVIKNISDMKNLSFDFDLCGDLVNERVVLGALLNTLFPKVKIFTPRIFTCFDDEISSGYTERYRVTFKTLDGDMIYSFFFSSRTNKVYVFKFDPDRNCISERGCFYKYKLI